MPAQGDPEQKLDPGHCLIVGADTRAALDQMQLEVLHVIRCRSLRRSPEPGRKPLAGSQVAGLRRRPRLRADISAIMRARRGVIGVGC